jgi:hypothetical protein
MESCCNPTENHSEIEISIRSEIALTYLSRRKGLLQDTTVTSDTFVEEMADPDTEQVDTLSTYTYARSENRIEFTWSYQTTFDAEDESEAVATAELVNTGAVNTDTCHSSARVISEANLFVQDFKVAFNLDNEEDKHLIQAIAQAAQEE